MNDDIQIPYMPVMEARDCFADDEVVPYESAERMVRLAVQIDRQNRLTELEQRADEEAEQSRVALLDRQRRAPTDDEIIDLALATEHGGEAGGSEPRLHYFRDSDIVEFALRLLRLNGTAQAQPDHSAGVSKMVGPNAHVEQPLNMVEPVSDAGELPQDLARGAWAAACRMAADISREAWTNHVYATGLDGMYDRCKQMQQVLLEEADRYPQPSGNADEPDWLQRLRVEQRDLAERYAKLEAFIDTYGFSALTPTDRSLLVRQAIQQHALLQTLNQGINGATERHLRSKSHG